MDIITDMKTIGKFLYVAMAICVVTTAFAQNIKTYSGPMKMPEYIPHIDLVLGGNTDLNYCYYNHPMVEVKYSYYENKDGKRIKHGKFILHSYKGHIMGNFKNDVVDGIWYFVIGDESCLTNGNYDLAKFKKSMNLFAAVPYKDGKMNGTFAGKLSDISYHFWLNGTIANNCPVGKWSVKIQDSWRGTDNLVFQISFDENGYAHGDWVLKSTSGILKVQHRIFNHGILEKITEYDESTGETETIDNLRDTSCPFGPDYGATIIRYHETLEQTCSLFQRLLGLTINKK